MTGHTIQWTEEQDNYLKQEYPNHSNKECLEALRGMGYKESKDAMARHAVEILHLRKSPEWMKADKQRRAKLCNEKRGEEFNERQRQRALHPGESGWWGGKHNDGSKMPAEKKSYIAKTYLHTDEVEKKARESIRKTISRDKRRVRLGLEPLSRFINIGNAMTEKQKNIRYQMAYENHYLIFRGDKHIYYDKNTKRSEKREQTAMERSMYVYPITERMKFAE